MEKLIIFAKAPRAGEVKTRLAAKYGAQKACDIYRELLGKVAKNLRGLKAVEIRFAPADGESELREYLQPGWNLKPQGEGELGERLQRAIGEALEAGARKVVVIGADCPEVEERDVRQAWKELEKHDLVLGPAADGGYWLIAMKSLHAELFRDIPWSSDQVLGRTLKKARELQLRIQLLRILSDIDTPENWNAYQRSILRKV